jgi:hypothetical protein
LLAKSHGTLRKPLRCGFDPIKDYVEIRCSVSGWIVLSALAA